MPSSSSSSETTFQDFIDDIEDWWEDLKSNLTLSSLTQKAGDKVADLLDDELFAASGSHSSPNDASAIKTNIANALNSLWDPVTDAGANAGINQTLSHSTGGQTPTGLDAVGTPTVSLSAGPIDWKIGGTPSVKMGSLVSDIVSGNFSNLNPTSSAGANISWQGNTWTADVSASYSRTFDTPSGSRTDNWSIEFKFRIRF